MTEFRRPGPLDTSKHDRSGFACRDAAYSDWLQRFASQSRRGNTAAVWVIADSAYRVVAYATLSMTSVDLARAPTPLGKGAPDPVPALLIGRLAVDQAHEGLGIASELVKHILATGVELNDTAAFKAVVVTALNDGARRWWADRFGFTPFDPDDPTNFDMYLLTKDIAATLGL